MPKRRSQYRCYCLVLALVLSCGCAQAKGTRVWIDTDPAIGSPFRDVDDAFALILAFHSPELRIAGISTTYGNAGLRRTTLVSARSRPAVWPGRWNHRGGCLFWRGIRGRFQTRTAASEALSRALRKERLTYIALGPLTNLAAVLEQHPNLAGRFERVIFVGGRSARYDSLSVPRVPGGSTTPTSLRIPRQPVGSCTQKFRLSWHRLKLHRD